MRENLLDVLHRRMIVGDGAMGTLLYQYGMPVGINNEELNLSNQEIIARVHQAYYRAGARLIETNTFGANRESLMKHGLEGSVRAINRHGVRLARQAVGDDAYVAGAVGAIRAGKLKALDLATLEACYREQMEALLEEGVDALLLETFFEYEELALALRVAKRISDVPVICQFAVSETERTLDGIDLNRAIRQLRESGADVIGFNCRVGPQGVLRAVEQIRGQGGLISAFPNAGLPDYVDGRFVYKATPAYFAQSAKTLRDNGVSLIGGCCGTTPEHIEAIAEALAGLQPLLIAAEPVERPAIRVREPEQPENTFKHEHRQLTIPELADKRHTVIVELDPPKDLDIEQFMKGAQTLKEAGADALTMADNSLAVTRMSNMALGYLVQEKLGIRPLLHMACRDRNLIGQQSHLMGLHALGLDHVLAVTGDPARLGDLPGASSVYDLSSFDMIRMIKQLNSGVSFSGLPLKQKARFTIAAAFNPNVKQLDKAIKRLERKVEAGADYIMTQPIYDAKLIEALYQKTRHIGIPIFIGIMPLVSARNAEFLHNEVPGIELSDEVRSRMARYEGERARQEGIMIAKELLDVSAAYFNGVYLMTPFMRYEMTAELTKYVLSRHREARVV
jgi:homocysteine S-methyltransferase